MSTMRFRFVFSLAIVFAAASMTAALAQAPAVGPVVKPAGVAKVATMPVPANAKTATAAGTGSVAINTSNSAQDTDSTWVAKFDIDGDGDVEETSFVWDDEDKVLFAYADDSFTCKKGGTGNGGLLVGVNAAGNPRKRPAGSGFWVAQLDKSECNSATDTLWGCKFDASGKETTCGTVTIDDKNDDIIVTAVAAN